MSMRHSFTHNTSKTLDDIIVEGLPYDTKGYNNPNNWWYSEIDGVWKPQMKISFTLKLRL